MPKRAALGEGFKVVRADNFNRDNVSERWLMETPVTRETAQVIADALNAEINDNGLNDFWATVVPEDHKLYVWEP